MAVWCVYGCGCHTECATAPFVRATEKGNGLGNGGEEEEGDRGRKGGMEGGK